MIRKDGNLGISNQEDSLPRVFDDQELGISMCKKLLYKNTVIGLRLSRSAELTSVPHTMKYIPKSMIHQNAPSVSHDQFELEIVD